MLTHSGADPPLLTDPDAATLGVRIAFTSRLGGTSEAPYRSLNLSTMVGDDPVRVEQNRRLVETAGGFPDGSLTLARQVHGATVVTAGEKERGLIGEGDALVARAPGPAVGVLTADCVPVLVVADDAVAAVHAGWRGLVAGVIEAALGDLGPVHKAWVGPAISDCCYEVGPEVIEAFEQRDLPVTDRSHVSPSRAAGHILQRCGVDNVDSAGICTHCDERYFSHRRDGNTGRQGAFITWL